jgi:hypothetical protein
MNSEILWYRDNTLIASTVDSGFYTTAQIKGNELTGILRKEDVSPIDAATYKCQDKYDTTQYYIIDIKVSKSRLFWIIHSLKHKDCNLF